MPSLTEIRHRFGITAALHDLAIAAINRLLPFSILRIYRFEQRATEFALPPSITVRELSADELRRYCQDTALDLGCDFVEQAVAKEHRCLGAFDGEQLAGYAWHCGTPNRTHKGLLMRFDDDLIYSYKHFTPPKFRGARLQSHLKYVGLPLFRQQGAQAIIFGIESQNFPSIRSAQAIGATPVGFVLMTRIGRYRCLHSPGLQQIGFTLRDAG